MFNRKMLPVALYAALIMSVGLPALPVAAAGADDTPPAPTGRQPDDRTTTDPQLSPPGASGDAPSDEMTGGPALAPDIADADTLIGTKVRTNDGQAAGEIRDFLLTAPGGRINAAVIDSAGVLGLGRKLIAVPIADLTLRPGGPAVIRSMTSADLETVPAFRYGPDSQPVVGRRD